MLILIGGMIKVLEIASLEIKYRISMNDDADFP